MRLKRNYNRGALLLGVLVIILAIVIIGLVAYAIFKALSRLKPRQLNPDDVAQWKQAAAVEIEQNPGATILSDGTFVQPLGNVADVPIVTVEWTTNLTDWYTLTNIPVSDFNNFIHEQPTTLPYAFYRWSY